MKQQYAFPKGFFEPIVQPFAVMSSPQNMSYKVNVTEEFTHPDQFQEIVDVLDQANEGDFMCMNVASGGGALHAILPLLGAMKHTPCHIHVHVASDSASAATLIMMNADSISVNDYVTVMFHQVSFGAMGQGNQVAAQVAHTMKVSEQLLRDSYKHFFSDSDMDRMLNGTEFYLDKEEFIQRYDNRQNLIEEDMANALEAAIAAKEAEEAIQKATKPKKVSLKTVGVAKADALSAKSTVE